MVHWGKWCSPDSSPTEVGNGNHWSSSLSSLVHRSLSCETLDEVKQPSLLSNQQPNLQFLALWKSFEQSLSCTKLSLFIHVHESLVTTGCRTDTNLFSINHHVKELIYTVDVGALTPYIYISHVPHPRFEHTEMGMLQFQWSWLSDQVLKWGTDFQMETQIKIKV